LTKYLTSFTIFLQIGIVSSDINLQLLQSLLIHQLTDRYVILVHKLNMPVYILILLNIYLSGFSLYLIVYQTLKKICFTSLLYFVNVRLRNHMQTFYMKLLQQYFYRLFE